MCGADRGLPTSRTQGGFTLLEVMIALLIFGVGVLSVAALQGVSKRANYEALQRTTASFLAMDMMERMRVNTGWPNKYTGGGVNTLLGTNPPRAAPANRCETPTLADGCNASRLSEVDLWEWEQAIIGFLEEGTDADGNSVATGGLVAPTACLDGPPGGGSGLYTVAIAWRGVTELEYRDTTDDLDCGVGSGLYDNADGETDVLRRVLVVSAYIEAD